MWKKNLQLIHEFSAISLWIFCYFTESWSTQFCPFAFHFLSTHFTLLENTIWRAAYEIFAWNLITLSTIFLPRPYHKYSKSGRKCYYKPQMRLNCSSNIMPLLLIYFYYISILSPNLEAKQCIWWNDSKYWSAHFNIYTKSKI